MFDFISPGVDQIVNSNYSLLLLAAIAVAESTFLPIPPDVFLIPLSLLNPPLALLYALVTTLASVSGGLLGYFIGNKGGKPIVSRFISDEKLYKVKLFYNKYDIWAILVAAFSPIPYKVFTISAGLFDLNIKRFLLASVVGRGGRFFLIGLLIFTFGPAISNYLSKYFELFTIAVGLLLIGGFVVVNLVFKKQI